MIASHSATSNFNEATDYFPNLLPMIRRFPNLYCDTSVLAEVFRWRALPRMLQEPEILDRAVHASDIPFPANAMVFWNRLHYAELYRLAMEDNLFERDYRLKLALGVPAAIFERSARLLKQMS